MLQALGNNIIFQFCDKTVNGLFSNNTRTIGSIIVAAGSGDQTGVTRWGKVVNVGPGVKDVKVNDYICIDAGKWTPYFLHDDQRYWKTNEDQIMMIDNEPHYYEF